jgi:hypothetical protein
MGIRRCVGIKFQNKFRNEVVREKSKYKRKKSDTRGTAGMVRTCLSRGRILFATTRHWNGVQWGAGEGADHGSSGMRIKRN